MASSREGHDSGRQFDLQPHPRILPMLGEINIESWQCIAELIDNSIDAFLSARDDGKVTAAPQIVVSLPTKETPHARVTVQDNGPGMGPETLENAVKAGWTSNDPIGHLGIFGMGFNIATARLGKVTHVWSTRPSDDEWHGLEIDFDKLAEQGHFQTPILTRPKVDPVAQGTEVTIERLKPDHLRSLTKSGHRARINRQLARVYSSMLVPEGVPIAVDLKVNTKRLQGHRHCVWGDPHHSEPRLVTHRRYGEIEAFQRVESRLTDRPYCTKCWTWLSIRGDECPACGGSGRVRLRQRRISGWVGVQRYLDPNDYGIDLLRNGRKIEVASHELFEWKHDSVKEVEYPIDDPRRRGRLVGELHLDHCRVHYTKDRFDRNDPAWRDMIRVVRGDGPLLPDKARQAGYGENRAPLFLLFQAFRRSKPKKGAGSYGNGLVVPDNELAKEMAERFRAGDSEYQSDAKWWKLVKEKDREDLYENGGQKGGEEELWPNPDEKEPIPPENGKGDEQNGEGKKVESLPRDAIASLSRDYRDEVTNQQWAVKAYAVDGGDRGLGGEANPWKLRQVTAGRYEFLVDVTHPVFLSATMTPLDGLLAELSWSAMDFLHGRQTSATFGSVLASLRERYAGIRNLDPVELNAEAAGALRAFAGSLADTLSTRDAKALFQELGAWERQTILGRLAHSAGSDVGSVIDEGLFLKYAPGKAMLRFFEEHPELFFDGRYWETQYEGLDFGNQIVTENAKREVLRRFASLLADAIWLAESDPGDLEDVNRSRLLRASLALDLLAANVQEG